MRVGLASLLAAAVACGAKAPPPAPSGPPAALVATPAPGDNVVARVDGRPIFASCVAVQAAHARLSARGALARCIDFELLALAAERAGKATDREVVLATKSALASRAVELVYEDAFTKPADLGSAWTRATDTRLSRSPIWQFQHDEFRASTYVRVPVPEHASADADAAAHALADRIAVAAHDERGLFGADLRALAEHVTPLEACAPQHYQPCWQDVPPYREGGLGDAAYATALFAIPEVGRASAAVRTALGWDVIAWTDVVPKAAPSPAELDAKLLPIVQRAYFGTWVDGLARGMGLRVEIAPDVDAHLQAVK